MVRTTYPGVYIQEIPSGVRTITGVATSIAAFIDFFPEGPLDRAVALTSAGDFERAFGGLDSRSEASYAIAQFFVNGGSQALAVRVTNHDDPAQSATVIAKSGDGAKDILRFSARTPGAWGNNVRVALNEAPNGNFNLTVTRYDGPGADAKPVRIEKILNVSMDQNSSRYVVGAVQSDSTLIDAARLSADADNTLPAFTDPAGAANVAEYALGYNAPAAAAIPAENGGPCFRLTARAGVAGNLRAEVLRLDTPNQFRLKINQYGAGNTLVASSVTTVTLNSALPADAIFSEVNQGTAAEASAAPGWDKTALPLATGTVSGEIPAATKFSDLSGATLQVSIGAPGAAAKIVTLDWADTEDVSTLAKFAPQLEKALRAADTAPAFQQATVAVFGNRLQVIAGRAAAASTSGDVITFQNGEDNTAADTLKLTAAARANVQEYVLAVSDPGRLKRGQPGLDGGLPGAADLVGADAADPAQVKGLYALKFADLFNLLCIPRAAELTDDAEMDYVISQAVAWCESRRAFLLIDPPPKVKTAAAALDWIDRKANYRSPNAALFFPRIQQPDPLAEYRLKSRGPSGTVAGLFARTDGARGVWKAPAGTEAVLRGASGLDVSLTDAQNGALNQIGVDCLRQFPVYGLVSWGARTLAGADQAGSEWKYIPIRRLALFLEESLFRGTKWVVFEPNDEPLWAKIRLNLNAFLFNLFRQGAFQGSTPAEAYYVKCDAGTTTQDDRNRGIVNIEVGFAPLKPAEFVVLKFQQIAGKL